MMGIPGPEDDRLGLALPGGAHVGDRTLCRRGRGGKRGEYDNPGKLRHGRGSSRRSSSSFTFGKGPIPRSARLRLRAGRGRKEGSLNIPLKEPGKIIEHVGAERKCKAVYGLPLRAAAKIARMATAASRIIEMTSIATTPPTLCEARVHLIEPDRRVGLYHSS